MGYSKNSDQEPLLKEPIFKVLDEKLWTKIKREFQTSSRTSSILCRIIPFQDSSIGTGLYKGLDLNIKNEYFIITKNTKSFTRAKTAPTLRNPVESKSEKGFRSLPEASLIPPSALKTLPPTSVGSRKK